MGWQRRGRLRGDIATAWAAGLWGVGRLGFTCAAGHGGMHGRYSRAEVRPRSGFTRACQPPRLHAWRRFGEQGMPCCFRLRPWPSPLRGSLWLCKSAVLPICRTRRVLIPTPAPDNPNEKGPALRGLFHLDGGEGGIRTLDTFDRIHTFQACSFSRSDTSPILSQFRALKLGLRGAGEYTSRQEKAKEFVMESRLWRLVSGVASGVKIAAFPGELGLSRKPHGQAARRYRGRLHAACQYR